MSTTVTKIVVNIKRQKLFAFAGEALVLECDCVTGREGKETHVGVYKVLSKVKDYTSKTYGSKMPYSMFFSPDKKAIHESNKVWFRSMAHVWIGAGKYTGFLGSHGCVGLNHEHAEFLFGVTPVGTMIQVVSGE